MTYAIIFTVAVLATAVGGFIAAWKVIKDEDKDWPE